MLHITQAFEKNGRTDIYKDFEIGWLEINVELGNLKSSVKVTGPPWEHMKNFTFLTVGRHQKLRNGLKN
jgi:hypothetical protein